MKSFSEILKSELQKPLPGTAIQMEMAPPDRLLMNFPRGPGPGTRVAAVLVLLYPDKGTIFTVFMQRPDYEGVHSGQISFPGGRKELPDTDLIETALREAREEVGADPSKISVIGTLTPLFIPVSDTLVTPVVGWTNEKPEFKLQAEEVVFLIEGELKRFFEPVIKTTRFEVLGEMRDIKYFDYKGYVIWGATAMILNELLVIIRNSGISLDAGLD